MNMLLVLLCTELFNAGYECLYVCKCMYMQKFSDLESLVETLNQSLKEEVGGLWTNLTAVSVLIL